MPNTINIRPGVGYLSILSAINYTPWHATAEFVDNSLQSYLDNKSRLKKLHNNYKLKIDIYVSSSVIEIKDNAGGISKETYERAFQAAMRPKRQTGLSEFGMGMKTAACWFSNLWFVKSKALGEDFATEAKFDIEKITKEKIEKLSYKTSKMNKNNHYTIVTLKDLNHNPRGRSVERIKDHLASMYRAFIERDEIEIRYNGSLLKFKEPIILNAVDMRDVDNDIVNPKKKIWKKNFSFEFPVSCGHKKHSVKGKIGIRETMDGKRAGFAVFRRNRLIFGSDDEPWRPLKIIRQEGSAIAKRLYGELYFDDEMEVTHTKDNINWSEDDKEIFLNKLKSVINSDEMPIISQSDRFKKNDPTLENSKIHERATASAVGKLSKVMLALEDFTIPKSVEIPKELPKTKSKAIVSKKRIHFEDQLWTVYIKLNRDKETHNQDWLQISLDPKSRKNKIIEIQIMMNKGYTSQYFGDQEHELEGLELLASYIALAEIISKERGEKNTHLTRYYINKIIDTVPPTID
tara:strand:- start:369 stop:1922 length:1554 start_codon:yes stop_codon:yes gene_type:complete